MTNAYVILKVVKIWIFPSLYCAGNGFSSDSIKEPFLEEKSRRKIYIGKVVKVAIVLRLRAYKASERANPDMILCIQLITALEFW